MHFGKRTTVATRCWPALCRAEDSQQGFQSRAPTMVNATSG